ncbi:apoptosis regulator BAX-like isoform X1 [Sceloporus undulatus]|uniref:apoptosis regulator BAX-like isoform X1 n=1 Tax=Sceloporus undulatus TaxID=8520 RepID=UPI001C4DC916|nr:apoptosis regulator BAX-like isoform X1 [Sceloporus undulatus]
MPFCFSFRGLFPDTLKKVGLGEVHSPRGKEGRHRKPCPPEPTAFPGALFLAFSGEVAFWMASGGQEPWQTAPSDGGSAMSDSIFNPSNRKRLLIGFIKTLWQEYKASELTHREDLPVEEDVPDDVQVTSLQDCMLRILQDLRSNAEIPSMVESISGEDPLKALADVSESMFANGINWGRIVVFFYFSYKVIAQSSLLDTVVDWAMNFLKGYLADWIQKKGGWISMLSYSPSSE